MVLTVALYMREEYVRDIWPDEANIQGNETMYFVFHSTDFKRRISYVPFTDYKKNMTYNTG